MKRKTAKEIIKELEPARTEPLHVELPKESRFELYKRLKESGYPQGGGGQWMGDINSTDKVYIPNYQELISHFVADPSGWEKLTDALTRVFIENNDNSPTKKNSS